jgi:hypothetical protein
MRHRCSVDYESTSREFQRCFVGCRLLLFPTKASLVGGCPDTGFYHPRTEVRKATLTDISLVVAPVNPAALVTSRRRLAPTAEFYGLMERKIECIIKTTALIQKGVHP